MAAGKKWATDEERRQAALESSRLYRERNAQRIKQSYRERRGKILDAHRSYYDNNRETLLAKARAYRQENADKIAAWRSDPKIKARLIAYNLRYKQEHSLPPLSEVWPYGATGYPIDLINETVPLSVPETIRPDVCQELCLMLFAGALEPDEVAGAVQQTVRKAWGEYAISIDWRRSDGWALADRLAQEELWI